MAGRSLRRYLAIVYGSITCLLGLGAIAYTAGFLANVVVSKSVDTGVTHSVGDPLLVDVLLIGLFGLQHSVMARPRFKAAWTRIVPEPIERSTYVLFAALALAILLWGWRPVPDVLWRIRGAPALIAWGVSLGGWLLMFAAVAMIDMLDLLGLRQVWAYFHGRVPPPIEFQTPAAYRYVRHPIMTGFLVAFWATPRMTVGHLVFAAGMTVYVIVGVTLEQRDMVAAFGDRYRQYRSAVPMFVPRPGRSVPSTPVEGDSD